MKKLAALPRITVAMSLAALPTILLAQTTPPPQAELSEIEVLAKRVNARNRVDTARSDPLVRRGILPALRAALGRGHDEARTRCQLPERHRRVRRAVAARHRQRIHPDPGQWPARYRRHQRQHRGRRPDSRGAGRTRRDHQQPEQRHRQPGRRRHAQHHPEGRRRAVRRYLPRRRLLQRRRDQSERLPVIWRHQRQRRVGHFDQLPGAVQPQVRQRNGADPRWRGRRRAGILRGRRGPGRAREHGYCLDRRRAGAARRGARMVRGRLLHGHRSGRDRGRARIRRRRRRRRSRGRSGAVQPARRIQRDELRRLHGLRKRLRQRPFLAGRDRV